MLPNQVSTQRILALIENFAIKLSDFIVSDLFYESNFSRLFLVEYYEGSGYLSGHEQEAGGRGPWPDASGVRFPGSAPVPSFRPPGAGWPFALS